MYLTLDFMTFPLLSPVAVSTVLAVGFSSSTGQMHSLSCSCSMSWTSSDISRAISSTQQGTCATDRSYPSGDSLSGEERIFSSNSSWNWQSDFGKDSCHNRRRKSSSESLLFIDLAICTILLHFAWFPNLEMDSLSIRKDFLNISFQEQLSTIIIIFSLHAPMGHIYGW